MSEARERFGRPVSVDREGALELRAEEWRLSEARERFGRPVSVDREGALELRAEEWG
ncbi:MAG: hypothetical protein ACRCYQ_06035 [Nocardioides sp.]